MRNHLAFPAALVGFLAIGCGGDEPDDALDLGTRGTPRVLEIQLDQPPVEGGAVASPFTPPQADLTRVLDHIRAVEKDKDLRGLFLRLAPFSSAWGRARDLILALADVRAAGKPVHCHFEVADNAAYVLLAEACDRVTMTPTGHVDLVGPAAHLVYARELLSNVGVVPELLQVGKYKGAADPLTEREMPAETAETLGAILDQIEAQILGALTESRGLAADAARDAIDGGPYDARGALDRKLVDALAFDDEARHRLREAAKVKKVHRVDLMDDGESVGLVGLLRMLLGRDEEKTPRGPRIALLRVEGTIADGEDDDVDGVQSGPFVRAIRRFTRDDDVRAIVLRIDSPGGSAIASDRMWHAVHLAARKKPVIATVGDMAASGGYYVASAATEILAHDESLIGSIGVVAGKFVVGPLAERIGVNVAVLERGAHAGWASPFRPMRESERRVFERMLDSTYARFVDRVATGRKMPRKKVLAAAEGRLFAGATARERGLVDRTGGLSEALARARTAATLPTDAPVETWPGERGFLDTLTRGIRNEDQLRKGLGEVEVLRSLLGPAADPALELLRLPGLLARERAVAALPFALRIE